MMLVSSKAAMAVVMRTWRQPVRNFMVPLPTRCRAALAWLPEATLSGLNDKLILYGLFKQANQGDNKDQAPSQFNIKATAKYNSWKHNTGMSADDAKRLYIKKVTELSKSSKQNTVVG